jgi:3'-phosphoadenosine 5'-phosphosulfate sulfotransferase (PAPS reductase)/FAD synthetase
MTAEDLKAMQAWPLERKIQVTQTRIMEWYMRYGGQVYVSFSGGLDSTVLLDLVRRVYPGVEAVFVNTSNEFPEIIRFTRTFPNVREIKPEMNYAQVVRKYGYPVIGKEQADYIHRMQTYKGCKELYLRGVQDMPLEWLRENFSTIPFSFFKCMFGLSRKNERAFIEDGILPKSKYRISKKWRYLIAAPFPIDSVCCRILKKRPLQVYEKQSGKKPIVGTTAEESLLRKQVWLKNGCNAFDAKAPKSTPMSFWTRRDTLRYILLTGIPYAADIYGEIKTDASGALYTAAAQRTGCMGCLFGCTLEKEPNRLQRLKLTHPKVYRYLFDTLDYGRVCDFVGIAYE